MSDPAPRDPAQSFGSVAEAYDRGRPGYPTEAVAWLVGDRPATVLELGAGTGKLTEQLVRRGCAVTATDPSTAMLSRLARRAPQARAVAGTAEQVPAPARSFDLVVAAQSFHWFDPERALAEVARVLRPGGRFALVWNARDERIPWVRRLGRILHGTDTPDPVDHAAVLDASGMFETVERATFRFWQPMTRESLRDLAVSRSGVATLAAPDRDRVLAGVDELYTDYGRGHDGMLLPYVTTVFRTVVLPWAVRTERGLEDPPHDPAAGPRAPGLDGDTLPPEDDGGPGDLLIDFR
jgi:SAM-dependent methyltransferase